MLKNCILRWQMIILQTRIVYELNRPGGTFACGKKYTLAFYPGFTIKEQDEKLTLTPLI